MRRVCGALALALIAAPAAALAGEEACLALAQAGRFAATSVTGLRSVQPDAQAGLPGYCELTATIRPVPGSEIGVVYRLPANWNGKLLGIGGGGMAGNVKLETAAPNLARGYATGQTDMGHPGPGALDPSWALAAPGQLNEERVIDFGHRATHLMTVLGKQIVQAYYGRPQSRAYWEGCSTGGRQGLMEMQRYPDDYDGVVAGAPVYNMLVYSTAVLRTQHFHATPGSNLTPAQLQRLSGAVMNACDAQDGVKDGILTDPRQCKFDPAVLQCQGAGGGDCLSPQQVETVRKMYQGVETADGRTAAAPLLPGGEPDWLGRSLGNEKMKLGLNSLLGAPFISYLVKKDPKYDLFSFDPNKDVDEAERSFARREIAATDADLSAFFRRGGKLILWHGFNDPGPSPVQTAKYYEEVAAKVGGAIEDRARLFMVPGVYHCRGGPGPDKFDALAALDDWVEKGTAPARILATRADRKLSRPLCPYPQLARYIGSGDPNDAASFTCAQP
jgi:feruloyl esterase